MARPSIFIVSGGAGSSGEQLARTALAQFGTPDVALVLHAHVNSTQALEAIVGEAAAQNGIVVHTLVNAALRDDLVLLAQERQVVAVDLIGPLLRHLARLLGQQPLGQPGLYRQLRNDYFERIAAIEFTVAHDDGQKPHELDQAEIVLTGVSRTGKTPLAMYLSTQGWRVANVPLIPQLDPPPELFTADPRRVIGVTIDPQQLLVFRRLRQQRLGTGKPSIYTDREHIEDELRHANMIFRQGGFPVINITDKSIEEAADEVLALLRRRLES